ncbi:unnamed protein product [Rotaria socialis]|uniref:Poly [ADP-ribose] polymerase n=1 Tax=Rotaria socialis TaxID=392032 RepID=A0A818SR88_9BILA|nr:unnamed protein product [Rotaria socialis]CAF4829009.1 unnamed protein product [Rotaria socialis]
MASENNDEQSLKQCIQLMVTVISANISSFGKKANEQQLLNDLQNTIEKTFIEKANSSLSSQCRNYLSDILNRYNYDAEDQVFSTNFTRETVDRLLHDLQDILALIDAYQAAWNGNESIVKDFIEKYPTLIDKPSFYGTTLLYSVARNNHINLVKYLVEIGKCSVNVQNEDYSERSKKSSANAAVGSTALHAACYQGHLQIVKYLIQHGADYFITNAISETPIDNGLTKPNIQKFFADFLLSTYSRGSDIIPKRSILEEIERKQEYIIDCFWEYKPTTDNRWFTFSPDASSRLQQSLIVDSDKILITEIDLKASRDSQKISIIQFLLKRKNDQPENSAWVRCRGSSLLNFRCYSQWQILFIKHPTGEIKPSPTIEILDMKPTKIRLNSWYNMDKKKNFLLERAMNYRRKYITINLDFINNEQITFDLENFIFNNQQDTVGGFLRWVPKFVSCATKLPLTNNSKLSATTDITLLTTSYVKQAKRDNLIPSDEIDQYSLKSDNILNDDILDLSDKPVMKEYGSNKFINVIQGNLLEEKTDVIVISSSSQYLFESVMDVGGKSLRIAYNARHKQNAHQPVISIPTDGKIASKAVYFVDWQPNDNPKLLCRSIQHLVSNVIETAASENYKSIAFPAIGCGHYGCSASLVAQTFVKQVEKELINHPMMISFVIQKDRPEVYDEFLQQIGSDGQKLEASTPKRMLIKVGEATLEIIKGDITKQKAHVIIGSSSSENLRLALIDAAGTQVENAYNDAYRDNPNSIIITTPGGNLECQKIFFLKWEPNKNPDILRQSIVDLIWNVIQNTISHGFTSIAFPAIGCGEHSCAVDIVVKTMIREMKQQMQSRRLAWHVKFIVQPNLRDVYDEFCKQLLSLNKEPIDFQVPTTWERDDENNIRFSVLPKTNEYKMIKHGFHQSMGNKYREIINIERIQNERWFMQYLAHSRDFYKRLNENTEKQLYHGCPESATIAIMEDCFNRSFAGVNGTAYGVGVYFSSNAAYSHGFAKANSKGERFMFVARVLIGKTIQGNSSMKTRPLGFDSTTDGNHIFVTYHDAQAYAEYLITYK